MGADSAFQYLNLTLEVFFLDLLLGGDNAVLIALACQSLQVGQRRQAMLIGTGLAIALRVALTSIAGFVLQIPALKLMGGVALTVIAIRLTDDQDSDLGGTEAVAPAGQGHMELLPVIGTVVVADLVMSMDNVIALAAAAKGSLAVLTLGLLLSVPLLMFGSLYVTELLQRYPLLTRSGGALLGWLAGDIAVADPLYAGWVAHQSPGLSVVVPALVATYVLLQSRIIEQTRSSAAMLRPARKVRRSIAIEPPRVEATFPQPPRTAGTPPMAPQGVEHELPRAVVPAVTTVPGRKRPWRKRLRWLALSGGGVIALGATYSLLSRSWLPIPAELTRYDCQSKDVSLYYRPGGQRIRITNGVDSASGTVQHDNQIDWGDYHAASSTLGFVPPTRVLFGNSQTLRIDGGMFGDASCNAAADSTRAQP